MSRAWRKFTRLPRRAVSTKLAIVDELRCVWVQRDSWNLLQQSQTLNIPMAAQSSSDAIQIAVVVTRMTAKFEDALSRQLLQNLTKRAHVEATRGGDSNSPIGRQHTRIANLRLLLEPCLETSNQLNLKPPHPTAMTQRKAPTPFERVTHSADGGDLSHAQQRASDRGKEMRMLMRIEMRDLDTGMLKLLHLSEHLALDLLFANPAPKERLNKVDKGRPETLAIRSH